MPLWRVRSSPCSDKCRYAKSIYTLYISLVTSLSHQALPNQMITANAAGERSRRSAQSIITTLEFDTQDVQDALEKADTFRSPPSRRMSELSVQVRFTNSLTIFDHGEQPSLVECRSDSRSSRRSSWQIPPQSHIEMPWPCTSWRPSMDSPASDRSENMRGDEPNSTTCLLPPRPLPVMKRK